ncbi:MAG: methyl-accepting chemotaxis protein, partial [Terracidiphilus sp.]
MHWTIKRKLFLIFVFVAAMMVGGTGLAYWAQLRGQATQRAIAGTSALLKDLEHQGSYVRAVTAMMRAYVISGDDQAVAGVPALRREADGVNARLKSAVAGDPELAADLERWQELLLERRAFTNKLVAARRNQGFEAAKTIFDTGDDDRMYTAMQQVFDGMTARATAQLRVQEAVDRRLQHEVAFMELFGVLAALVVLFGLAITVTRSIAKNIHISLELVEAMAQRDLSLDDGEPASGDELAGAIHAINRMKQSMADALGEVARSSAQVAGTGAQIEAAARRIAETSHSERKNVELFASSLAEMNSTVLEVAEHAEQASVAAGDAVASAAAGRNLVRETQDAMNRIRASVARASIDITTLGNETQSIGAVVRIVQEIAAQTNLLALNAAIEAARAGEQGKGFAVVAQEVRQLAERTARFTKEIAEKIEAVQKGASCAVDSMREGEAVVDEGMGKFVEVNQALEKIAGKIEAAQQGMAMIATATTQQSSATADLTENVHSLSAEVNQTSDQVDRTAEACSDLAKLARGLENLVATFRLPPEP